MAQVAPNRRPTWLIDSDLENLLEFWRTVPDFEAEWQEWDNDSREDFRIEWTIDRERLLRVTGAAESGLLDERQQREWQELRRLIETHRATVEGMLEGPI